MKTVQLTYKDMQALIQGVKGTELATKLASLLESIPGSRFYLECVWPSVMSKQERLNDLEALIEQIRESNVPPRDFRSEHHKAIGQATSIARTLFRKENEG